MSYQTQQPRVLLATLTLRTSKAGRDYVTGWVGASRLIGFEGEPDKYGNRTINLFLEAVPPKEERSASRELVGIEADRASAITYERQD